MAAGHGTAFLLEEQENRDIRDPADPTLENKQLLIDFCLPTDMRLRNTDFERNDKRKQLFAERLDLND